jgi:thioredoxin-dependent peroxiredoxin
MRAQERAAWLFDWATKHRISPPTRPRDRFAFTRGRPTAWKADRWAVLFSHPRDFTPVCTTELGAVASLAPEFEKRNTRVIGLSVDAVDDHARWMDDIADVTGYAVNFPLIADVDRRIATLYDMIHPNASDTATVRSVFVIGPDNKVKLTLTYPASTGRNFSELLRGIDSLQLTAKHSVATPADWKQGEAVIIVPAVSDRDAKVKFPQGFVAKKPYLRYVSQPLA